MKRLLTPVLSLCLVASACLFTSCDNKRDTNGDLGGMWQLTQWRDASDSLIATNEDAIYYSFELTLMKIQRKGYPTYLATFSHTPDSLILTAAYLRPDETLVPFSSLALLGVPADGRFLVQTLNSSNMVLSGQSGTLVFRKY